MNRYQVQQIKYLPLDELSPLLVESQKEGFQLIERLITDYQNGENRFDQPGEALFVVYHNKQLVGIGGINRDPYLPNQNIGRIRHVYIQNSCRRTGAGTQLLKYLIKEASKYFDGLTLRTKTETAGLFYENLGFKKTNHIPGATHFFVPQTIQNK